MLELCVRRYLCRPVCVVSVSSCLCVRHTFVRCTKLTMCPSWSSAHCTATGRHLGWLDETGVAGRPELGEREISSGCHHEAERKPYRYRRQGCGADESMKKREKRRECSPLLALTHQTINHDGRLWLIVLPVHRSVPRVAAVLHLKFT